MRQEDYNGKMQPTLKDIAENVRGALAEDIGSGDLTAQLIPATQHATAHLISREAAVLCGRPWFDACFLELDASIHITWYAKEGERIQPGQLLCELSGNARALLSGERTAMNFLQTLCGTATITRQYAEAIFATGAVVMDTRKTIPGLRIAQKYAVAVGGGCNQRIGLFDGVLIKENHIAAAGGILPALQAAQTLAGEVPIQIEVESLEELQIALDAGAKLVLLDNFSLDDMRAAVALNVGRAELEASGNITLENLRAVVETGVQRISVGSLTKHIRAIDLSMRIVSVGKTL